mmetsp:Transcript_75813/g.164113  ORF Transcript_75813/g.164113 Transcript_75813/m.164113 type:complete len:137 (-) Transcript_75813:1207-1617(-)
MSEFSTNPRLRDYVSYKFKKEFNIRIRYDKESVFVEKILKPRNYDFLILIVNQETDLDNNKFLTFWLENRLIKVKEKDKIKCWRQLGNLPIIEHSSHSIAGERDTKTFVVHIKDLLISMARRAIIYNNIECEIARI